MQRTAGYTNQWTYLTGPKNPDGGFTDSQWATIVREARAIIEAAEAQGIVVAGPNGTGRPIITDEVISLNGEGRDGHETFYLAKSPSAEDRRIHMEDRQMFGRAPGREIASGFCKTNKKPYDAVVASILSVANRVGRGVFRATTDAGAVKRVLASQYPSVAQEVEGDYRRKAITQGERRELLESIELAESQQDAERILEQARKGRTATADNSDWARDLEGYTLGAFPQLHRMAAGFPTYNSAQSEQALSRVRDLPKASRMRNLAIKAVEDAIRVLGTSDARNANYLVGKAESDLRRIKMATPPSMDQAITDTSILNGHFSAMKYSWERLDRAKMAADTFDEHPPDMGDDRRTAARYSGDPYWTTAKYPGTDANGHPFRKGDRVFYYPRTKTILTGDAAERASAEFDEDFGYRGAASNRVADEPPFHNAAKADDALGEAYRSLINLKLGFDSWHEIPSSAHPLYQQIMNAVDAVVTARQVTTQVRAIVARKRY